MFGSNVFSCLDLDFEFGGGSCKVSFSLHHVKGAL